ncbi:OsmC family protein [Chitinophaga caseinilytica]|uniref:OsmC family protein n=1 Tax=Chitinophaga caseinilytica TaxID=2267521 RepID=UPI003C2E37C1
MQHEIVSQWMGKMQFNSLVNGHTIIMDGPEKIGGENNGPIPKPLVLTALSGCTGMDVIALLRKAHQEITNFDVKVQGQLSAGHPMQYTAIHLDYIFEGPDTASGAALQAVQDSQEKFCGVSDMLKKIFPVTWDVVYNGTTLFSNRPAEMSA